MGFIGSYLWFLVGLGLSLAAAAAVGLAAARHRRGPSGPKGCRPGPMAWVDDSPGPGGE
ncbi:hypothetical protein [Streptomyces clavuligerus]|uniref:hypothetical protein n=1 Tax=Streptomyces clavuligerus TaxID=1901 RepID=UPI0012FEB742|nr:hypothetical protein [Streptomyces clavuligerus]MBY6303505.1 hypothetical protein [Streptomyces clavuligerus]QPJ94316.1 hypothetical protein GE265_15760 [Streptomyces clavuligerus]QPL63599.1 hypothetical protein I3J04_12470 [Streptomyces clavuligerus]QPL69627.1 hypothetical protein I3J05_12485 [Streptomyces clavuligerus]QPL75709.1 hypothetical protein I3J06_12485 [Streptomyces clavuligerus]